MTQIHCLALPHTISNADYIACAFTQKVRKFLTMFKDSTKYRTIHYGHADSVTDAHEHVSVTNNEVLEAAYGDYDWKKRLGTCDGTAGRIGFQRLRNRRMATIWNALRCSHPG